MEIIDTRNHVFTFLSLSGLKAVCEVGYNVPENVWRELIKSRWKPFYRILFSFGVRQWKESTKHILHGKTFLLEILDRGGGSVFKLSAYRACVRYCRHTSKFVCQYRLQANVSEEVEEFTDVLRLRSPVSFGDRHAVDLTYSAYDLSVSDKVEMQWRFLPTFEFGWWYGVVSKITQNEVHVTFCHFTTRWKYESTEFDPVSGCFIDNSNGCGAVRKLSPDEIILANNRLVRFCYD